MEPHFSSQYKTRHNRVLTAHHPCSELAKIKACRVLLGGLGGGSNIAELLLRSGFHNLTIADPDIYELSNIRQSGCKRRRLGQNKALAMREELLEIDDEANIQARPEGLISGEIEELVKNSDYVIDMLDFIALKEKIELYRMARKHNKTVLTAPSAIHGGVLFVFRPTDPSYEDFFGFDPEAFDLSSDALKSNKELQHRFLDRLIPIIPSQVTEARYRAAVDDPEVNLPLDPIGVAQAASLLASALINLVLGRDSKVRFVPEAVQVDCSNPEIGFQVIDFSQRRSEVLEPEVVSC